MAKKKKSRKPSPRSRNSGSKKALSYNQILNTRRKGEIDPKKLSGRTFVTPEEAFSLSRSKKESKATTREIAKNSALREKAGIKSATTPSTLSKSQRKAVSALEDDAANVRLEDTTKRREAKRKAKERYREKKRKEKANKAKKNSKAAVRKAKKSSGSRSKKKK